jgi:hypothetical protein
VKSAKIECVRHASNFIMEKEVSVQKLMILSYGHGGRVDIG